MEVQNSSLYAAKEYMEATRNEKLYDDARQFVGMMLAPVFTPELEIEPLDDDAPMANHAGYEQINLLNKQAYGEALSHAPCFRPFINELYESLIKTQEARHAA